jgi:hypothetical protein
MNGSTGGRRRLRRLPSRRTALLVVLAGFAPLTTACGGASANPPSSGTPSSPAAVGSPATSGAAADSGTSAATAGSSGYQKAVAYANCMRQHGVPNFPDPLSNGSFTLTPAVTGGTNGQFSSQYQAALSACESIEPSGTLSAQQQQHALDQLLKVSACMRSHGYQNFPDPTDSTQGITLHIVGFDRNSPQFQNAFRTCTAQAGVGSSAG